jgi:DNA gyrase/topoisomerase IV subunit A
MAKKELEIFKSDMDCWVKDIKSELNTYSDVVPLISEHTRNIDHNYELLQQMRAEITQLKEELSALRLVQILHLRTDVKKTKVH